MALVASNWGVRFASRSAFATFTFDDSYSAARRSNSALYQRESIWKRTSPLFTSCPDRNFTASMWPETRGRTSTFSMAAVCPLNSSHSTTSSCCTGVTVTTGGGIGSPPPCCCTPWGRHPSAPAKAADKNAVLKNFVITLVVILQTPVPNRCRARLADDGAR